jgi:hypothetical protein
LTCNFITRGLVICVFVKQFCGDRIPKDTMYGTCSRQHVKREKTITKIWFGKPESKQDVSKNNVESHL